MTGWRKRQVLEMALEALKCAKVTTSTPGNFLFFEAAITAIKEALAQPTQRTWVGLTDKEIEELVIEINGLPFSLCYAVEAKLKEKNT
jgi:hypothetical protein